MISELILCPFFSLLKNFLQFSFFFPHTSSVTTNLTLNRFHCILHHFQMAADEVPVISGKRKSCEIIDKRRENRTIEGGHHPRDGAEEYSWGTLINLFRVVSPFLNDSMIKCHEFPEPRYIIHRERGRRFDSARRPLTVPQQR